MKARIEVAEAIGQDTSTRVIHIDVPVKSKLLTELRGPRRVAVDIETWLKVEDLLDQAVYLLIQARPTLTSIKIDYVNEVASA